MREILLDIIQHAGVDTVSSVKITGTDDKTFVEAMGKGNKPIIKGTLKEPSKELVGEYGFGFFPLLSGLLNHTSYKSTDASIEIVRDNREGEEVPTEMIFRNEKGKNPASFRFINKNYIEHQLTFKGAAWDVEFTATPSAINEFASFAGLYSAVETKFNIKTEKDEVIFAIGNDASTLHRAEMVFASGVEETKASFNGIQWDITPVISVLKLGSSHNPTVKATSRGVIQIEFSTKFIDWTYIFPNAK